VDGVLGGFGLGTLPRVEATGSRLFLLNLYPELCTVPSAIKPLESSPPDRPYRALDVGAGIGRVTSDVLLHLVDHVLLLEPVAPLVQQALANARDWPALVTKQKSVTFVQGILQVRCKLLVLFTPEIIAETCQAFNPSRPLHPLPDVADSTITLLDRIGSPDEHLSDIDSGFDVIWCQWCLGYLDDPDLVSFLQRSKNALRDIEKGKSLIIVKENCCSDSEDGSAKTVFDEDDSSYTRQVLAIGWLQTR